MGLSTASVIALTMIQAVAGNAPARPAFTAAQVAGATPAALAEALLPAGHPPIVRAQILPEGGDPATRRLEAVLLYARPGPGPRGFCRSDAFRVAFAPFEYATDGGAGAGRYRPRAVIRTALFRVGDDAACLADTRGYFPIAGAEAAGLAAVRALAATRTAASAGARLPVVACTDRTGSGACGGGTRAILSGLRIDAIGSVRGTACATVCTAEILVGTAGSRPAYWTIALTSQGATVRRMTMAYTLSPAH